MVWPVGRQAVKCCFNACVSVGSVAKSLVCEHMRRSALSSESAAGQGRLWATTLNTAAARGNHEEKTEESWCLGSGFRRSLGATFNPSVETIRSSFSLSFSMSYQIFTLSILIRVLYF